MLAAAKPHQHPEGYRGKRADFAPYLISGSLDGAACVLLGCPRCIKVTGVRPRRNRKNDVEYDELVATVADPYGLRERYPEIGQRVAAV